MSENLALLEELNRRFDAYGKEKGYVKVEVKSATIKEEMLNFIISDTLGLAETPDAKFRSAITDVVKEFVETFLNSRGKRQLKLLETFHSMITASSKGEALGVLLKEGGLAAAAKIPVNWKTIFHGAAKPLGLNRKVRERVIRAIAMRLTWVKNLGGRVVAVIERLAPLILVVQLMLESEDTATDFEEQRLTYLVYMQKISDAQSSAFSKFVQPHTSGAWSMSMSVKDVFDAAKLHGIY